MLEEGKINSYPKIWGLGHSALKDLFANPVVIEEKIDGSQFSFGVYGGEIRCRSKGQQLILEAPEGMFIEAVETVKRLAPILKDGWTYRAEYLKTPKHNALAYDRIPKDHLMVYDINTGLETYLSYAEKKAECERIGLECVPLVHDGPVEDASKFMSFMNTFSVLGGQRVEGLVVKNYFQFGPDKKALMGKHVSDVFKEKNKKTWREENPTNKDVVVELGLMYSTTARWMKAVQHLKEAGKLEGSPRDIGILMKEVPNDILSEEEKEIKDALFSWAWPHIRRMVTRGLPEWYKGQLVESQFDPTRNVHSQPIGDSK